MAGTGAVTVDNENRPFKGLTKSSRKQVTARKKQEEEELVVLRKLASSLDKRSSPKQESKSPCIAFGKYIGEALLAMDERSRPAAVNNIQSAIFQAQMGGFMGNNFASPQFCSNPMQYGYPCSSTSAARAHASYPEALNSTME